MKWLFLETRSIKAMVVISAILFITLVVVPFFYPWTPLNCLHTDIDINTGRIRKTRYLLYLKISQSIQDSVITTLVPNDLIEGQTPEWRRVTTLTIGHGNSPHYFYHGAISQIHDLQTYWSLFEESEFHDALKIRMATHLLALWQHADSDWYANLYIMGLAFPENEKSLSQIAQTLLSIDMPLMEINGDLVTKTLFYPTGAPMERIHGYYDQSGGFVPHGRKETWDHDGQRTVQGHFVDGELIKDH